MRFGTTNQQKKHLKEIFQNAKNLTFGSGTADTAPAHSILPVPTHSVADPNTFQISFLFVIFSKFFFVSLVTG